MALHAERSFFVGPNVATIGECNPCRGIDCIRRGGVIGVGHVGYTLTVGALGIDLLATALPLASYHIVLLPMCVSVSLAAVFVSSVRLHVHYCHGGSSVLLFQNGTKSFTNAKPFLW